jgi:hypothetical protein
MVVQLLYEPVCRDVQISVPMDRIIKETRPNIRLPHHPTTYFEVWKFIFQFLKIMWILPGPEKHRSVIASCGIWRVRK